MEVYLRWLHRRLMRTARLLQHPETRFSMLRFILRHTFGAALIHGRGYARRRLARI
jgi:hypothetical protein